MSDLAVTSIGEVRPPRAARAGGPLAPRALLGLALPVGVALIWEALVRLGVSDGRLVAPPSRIVETLLALWRTGDLGAHLSATCWRLRSVSRSGSRPEPRSARSRAPRRLPDG